MIKYSALAGATLATKNAFIDRSVELLRLEHNIMGYWWNIEEPMLPLSEYQKLRNQVQTEWPYSEEKLSDVEWKRYRDTRFREKAKVLQIEKSMLKGLLMKSTRFSPNIDDDITDK